MAGGFTYIAECVATLMLLRSCCYCYIMAFAGGIICLSFCYGRYLLVLLSVLSLYFVMSVGSWPTKFSIGFGLWYMGLGANIHSRDVILFAFYLATMKSCVNHK